MQQAWTGWATGEGTGRLARRAGDNQTGAHRVAPGHFRETSLGLTLSSLGMGTYLGALDAEDSRRMTEAAVQSVLSGAVNVLDTAINYRHQLSERAIGQALRQLDGHGIRRDELLICSKNGFLAPDAHQHHDMSAFGAWFRQTFMDSGLVQPDEVVGGMHCLAPAYLQDQLQRSLSNLGVATLDVMYLHNAVESQLPHVGRDVLMQRLAQAFACYEQARETGQLRYYGLATWQCFRVPPTETAAYLNLEDVVRLAEQVGGPQHGFRFVQLPLNLAFTEALTDADQSVSGQRMTFLEAALALDVTVLASVPLLQGQLLDAPAGLPAFEGLDTPAQRCLQFVRSCPGVLAPLVGHKALAHVQENLQLARVSPLELPAFEALLATSQSDA